MINSMFVYNLSWYFAIIADLTSTDEIIYIYCVCIWMLGHCKYAKKVNRFRFLYGFQYFNFKAA